MFPLMRTFINNQHSTSIIQPHNQTSSLRCALHQHLTLNTYHPTNMFPQMRTSSTPNTQQLSANKHVPSDAHLINTQHSTPITQQTCSPRCAPHQHPTLNTHHPTNMFPQMRTSLTPNTQHPSPNKHVPSDAHFINTHHSTPNTQNSTPNTHQRHHILCETITSTYQPTPQDSGQEERLKASFLKLINTRFSP